MTLNELKARLPRVQAFKIASDDAPIFVRKLTPGDVSEMRQQLDELPERLHYARICRYGLSDEAGNALYVSETDEAMAELPFDYLSEAAEKVLVYNRIGVKADTVAGNSETTTQSGSGTA